jgi:hypothetical protein
MNTTNEITNETLEAMLAWNQPRLAKTARGLRQVRTAIPHGAFWSLWRAHKPQLHDLGISPKLINGSWTVNWYQEPNQAAVTAETTRSFVLPETKYPWSDEQIAIFKWFHSGTGSLVVRARAGTGKCLGLDVPILLHDGTIKRNADIVTGDLLMGPDGSPRRVLSTTQGKAPMFKIVPIKGAAWTCNNVHVLTLAGTNHRKGIVRDVALNQLLSETRNQNRPDMNWKLFKPAMVNFPTRPNPEVDPYFFGLWIGDGTKETRTHGLAAVSISKPDSEVLETCKVQAAAWGLTITTQISCNGCPPPNLQVK